VFIVCWCLGCPPPPTRLSSCHPFSKVRVKGDAGKPGMAAGGSRPADELSSIRAISSHRQDNMGIIERSILDQARSTGTLYLSHRNLTSIPEEVFGLTNLVRLDLGWNQLATLSPRIGELTKLEELWLNHNPLESLPVELENCAKIKVLDLRNTSLRRLPNEIGRLNYLYSIDLRGAKLKPKQWAVFADGGTYKLLAHLKNRDLRKEAKIRMFSKLREGIYRGVCDTPGGPEEVQTLVKDVIRTFDQLEEIKSLIRNVERLFPEDIMLVDIPKIRDYFFNLRRENEMKKLAAELELKIRVIYFDRIKVETVEDMVHEIYNEIHDLDDIKFLIRYAPRLFPPTAEEVTGEGIADAVLALQEAQAKERSDAIDGLVTALKGFYGHVDPPLIIKLANAVSAYFKKVEDLKKLAADVTVFFPTEFEMANAKETKKAFLLAAKEADDE
jgi:hypothetical protein